MMASDDYLSRHEASLIAEGSDTRLLVSGNNVIFGNMTEMHLRAIVNDAVGVAVRHFAAHLARAPISISAEQIEQVAIKVVLSHLYVKNMWKNHYDEHKDLELKVSADDLEAVSTRDSVRSFCEETFGESYADFAAALLGMARQDFVAWETRRQAVLDRF